MFKKVLVANRGEIAVRIMRTCERLAIPSVAVYSDADRGALHVRRAAESARIGPARAASSYLDIGAVIDAAVRTGADAIHPGYGFLSENPALAEACAAAGITFVGPPAAAMRLLGDKSAARQLAARHGVPVLPGVDAGAQDDASLVEAAASVGFPLMVKAAAGGGGRGMRLVATTEALPEALASARREAESAFGDGRLLIERAVIGGRHIEVQVLADAHGNAVHLGDRDCSVQRRHQKVIEESPAPGLDSKTHARMGAAALAVVRAAAYVNAGTVEFLLDRDGGFYFLEVNTRLQVEHPVTEMVTALDLVELQLRVAAGEPLPFTQDDLRTSGHAIECRICAEDPARGYIPSSGRVSYFFAPDGDGVRMDSGIETGSRVPAEYDSLLAKLIVHGASREEAVARCARALAACTVDGVKTNLALLQAVVAHDAFRTGAVDLGLLESMPAESFAAQLPDDVLLAAAAADAGPFEEARGGDPWEMLGAWRAAGRVRLEYAYHGRTFAVEMERATSRRWIATIDGRTHKFEITADESGHVIVRTDSRESAWSVERQPLRLVLRCGARQYTLGRVRPSSAGMSRAATGLHTGEMLAPMPGRVVRVLVAEGDAVVARQPLVLLEAMKIEHIVESSVDGVVRLVRCEAGQRVAEGEILIEVTSGADEGNATS